MNYEDSLKRIQTLVKNNVGLFSQNAYDISIMPGWTEIVEEFLTSVKDMLDGTSGRVNIVQIKEKQAGLKIYFGSEQLTEAQQVCLDLYLGLAQAKASATCVVCGQPGTASTDAMRTLVRCEEHRNETNLFGESSILLWAQHDDEMRKILKQK